MSCISVTLGTKPIGGATAIVHHPHEVSVDARTRTGWFDVTSLPMKGKVTAKKTGDMKLNIFLVCRVSSQEYLWVRPEETMWITVDKSIDYEVRSNTEWTLN